MNSPQDPNPSARPRMDLALCLLLRGLLPAGAPAWNTLGSPHPTLQNLQAQWAWGTAAQDHRETEHGPACPRCCRDQVPVSLNRIQPSMTWAGQEVRTPKTAQPPQATSASSMTSPEPPGSEPCRSFGLAQLWGAGELKPRNAQPGKGGAQLLPATVTWRPPPSSPIRKAADRSGRAA